MPSRPLTNRLIRAVINEVCPDDDAEVDPEVWNVTFMDALTRHITADMTPDELERMREMATGADFRDAMEEMATSVAGNAQDSLAFLARET